MVKRGTNQFHDCISRWRESFWHWLSFCFVDTEKVSSLFNRTKLIVIHSLSRIVTVYSHYWKLFVFDKLVVPWWNDVLTCMGVDMKWSVAAKSFHLKNIRCLKFFKIVKMYDSRSWIKMAQPSTICYWF